MATERQLKPEEAGSASVIQHEIDRLAATGGRLILPEMDLTLDRGLRLRTGVELTGQGKTTVLRKGPGRIYPLTGYHNYGMADVPLQSTEGLEVGMTVSIHDNRTHSGFYETFATITWIEDGWVGLDHGLEADYGGDAAPCLTTVYPLIFGLAIRDAAVRDLRLEGNQANDEKAMGGCRGGAVYFANCRNIEISGIRERDYRGEGLSFQMCQDMRISDCHFNENAGNGLHPGAGSTNALFERCEAQDNAKSGFFFCVRANHITVRDCRFRRNDTGVSIGTRDCHNLIETCVIEENAGAGILVRRTPPPIEVHSCLIRTCRISGNAYHDGQGQIEIAAGAHDLVLSNNQIGGCAQRDLPGVFIEQGVTDIFLEKNKITGCTPEYTAEMDSLAVAVSHLDCGYGAVSEAAYRHLTA